MKFPARGTGPAALVLSFLSLAVAVSGTAYAAHQLGRHDVRTYNLAPESVTKSKIAEDAVHGWRVKDGTLRAQDVRPGELLAGATGPRGEGGPAGPAGPPSPRGPVAPASSSPGRKSFARRVPTLTRQPWTASPAIFDLVTDSGARL